MKKYDISAESGRTYEYPDGSSKTIKSPITLFIKEGGTGHRILDDKGVVHWVPVNERYFLSWKPKDSDNPVQF